jgi:phosphohistidine phosphatase SixA
MGPVGVFLYLMRHGAAEDAAPSRRDADRSLTAAGRSAVSRIALAMLDALLDDGAAGSDEPILRPNPRPRLRPLGQIIASPLVRAHETAEIMRSILCPQLSICTDRDLAPEASAYDLAVRAAAAGFETLLVGHQPNIEMVARALATASSVRPRALQGGPGCQTPPLVRMPIGFRTATIVGFEVNGRPPPYRLALAMDPGDLPA